MELLSFVLLGRVNQPINFLHNSQVKTTKTSETTFIINVISCKLDFGLDSSYFTSVSIKKIHFINRENFSFQPSTFFLRIDIATYQNIETSEIREENIENESESVSQEN
jgi:hypothetical protein